MAEEEALAMVTSLRQLQEPEDRPKLGEIMFAEKVINHAELKASLKEAKKTGQAHAARIGSASGEPWSALSREPL